MNKKKMIFAFLSMLLSCFAFVVATYAWFAVSHTVSNSPLDLNVDPGIITSYEAHLYTYNNIFKVSSSDSTIYVYNSGWVAATHTDSEDIDVLDDQVGYDPNDFWGIVMKPYDPLIPDNNLVNNIILGIHITYDVDVNTNLSVVAIVDESIGHAARDAFGVTQGSAEELYFSQVVNFQMLPGTNTDVHGFNTAGLNLYTTLMTETYFEDTTTYPYSDFYDETLEQYDSSMVFYDDTVSPYILNAAYSDLYLYFNLSYNSFNTDLALSGLVSGDFGQINLYRFFQDITLVFRKEGEVV